jgi:hypothetical protein
VASDGVMATQNFIKICQKSSQVDFHFICGAFFYRVEIRDFYH